MGLSENQKNLIEAVSLNDIVAAKKLSIKCLEEDTTVKNSKF